MRAEKHTIIVLQQHAYLENIHLDNRTGLIVIEKKRSGRFSFNVAPLDFFLEYVLIMWLDLILDL